MKKARNKLSDGLLFITKIGFMCSLDEPTISWTCSRTMELNQVTLIYNLYAVSWEPFLNLRTTISATFLSHHVDSTRNSIVS